MFSLPYYATTRTFPVEQFANQPASVDFFLDRSAAQLTLNGCHATILGRSPFDDIQNIPDLASIPPEVFAKAILRPDLP